MFDSCEQGGSWQKTPVSFVSFPLQRPKNKKTEEDHENLPFIGPDILGFHFQGSARSISKTMCLVDRAGDILPQLLGAYRVKPERTRDPAAWTETLRGRNTSPRLIGGPDFMKRATRVPIDVEFPRHRKVLYSTSLAEWSDPERPGCRPTCVF